MEGELKKIKKLYGEEFAKWCKKNFSTILVNEGLLLKTLLNNFCPTKSLYNDIIESKNEYKFITYINAIAIKQPEMMVKTGLSAKELLKQNGYDLIECKTWQDVLNGRDYYSLNEKLCTFLDPARLYERHIFYAVKNNYKDIKRSDKPDINDEYSLSVLCIQFVKGEVNPVFVISRYNHSVDNPDAVKDNNLDKIVPGLINAFEESYGFKIYGNERDFQLVGYQKDANGKFFKINSLKSMVRFCNDNNVLFKRDTNNNVYDCKKFDKLTTILVDNMLIDFVNLKIEQIVLKDKTRELLPFKSIKDIKIKSVKKGKEILIVLDDANYIKLVVDDNNSLVEFYGPTITNCGDFFLNASPNLEVLYLPKCKKVGNNCFSVLTNPNNNCYVKFPNEVCEEVEK